MKIGIIGASGKTGTDLVQEAVSRGHEVTALVRDASRLSLPRDGSVTVVEKDAFALSEADFEGLDAVVNAFATAPEQAHRHVELAEHLVGLASAEAPRLVFILGAGSLQAEDGRLAVEHIRELPGSEQWISIPESQLRELEYLRTVDTADWVGISPQMEFEVGPAGTPVLGKDALMTDSEGRSRTTTGTMAVAVLDELEQPQHRRTRFTVVEG
jgi:uncharacterized protein